MDCSLSGLRLHVQRKSFSCGMGTYAKFEALCANLLAYLHLRNICVPELVADMVLCRKVHHRWRVQIADFGLSRLLKPRNSLPRSVNRG
jgi:hypothetical protein